MEKIIIASHNEGKVKEFREMFEKFNVKVVSLRDLDFHDEIEENGSTFKENASIKAETIANHFHEPVIADDSGLVIDALDGRPGVYSARYAGEEKDDKANLHKVLAEMEHVAEKDRSARFICVLAVAQPGKETSSVEGKCEGFILHEKRGDHGFGYDPIFYIPALGKTLAQLEPGEKNRISHRANALKELRYHWSDIFS
ncbi:XTP/dITP diphosphatase [Pseudalkalibacillus salsuginis]|uniref:XTP/dITP diphosphatase n=1 Tax=Pseudalkalibacillus salsuginis TaxID=2910972 RepID=UPI001F31D27D|nr:XTP/dITP diphosphatase [Pseudalkalibacillus salsuginis]MCF6408692.1 XTP/dITP diphosphatase [Pseudalkalibacillus salsuginis]